MMATPAKLAQWGLVPGTPATAAAPSNPFGSDLSCADDLDAGGLEVSGLTILLQAAHRRLRTARGGLLDDDNYGLLLMGFVSAEVTPQVLAGVPGAIAGELAKEDGIAATSTLASWDASSATLTLTITCQTALGPFALVLAVTDVTVTLLSVSA